MNHGFDVSQGKGGFIHTPPRRMARLRRTEQRLKAPQPVSEWALLGRSKKCLEYFGENRSFKDIAVRYISEVVMCCVNVATRGSPSFLRLASGASSRKPVAPARAGVAKPLA